MRSQREGGLPATTKVKVFSPEIANIAQGQGFHGLEARTAACVIGECDSGEPVNVWCFVKVTALRT